MPRPGAVLGRLLRAPVVLYELGAGPLLGHRFLLLVHRGWRIGLVRRTVLEVLRWDAAVGEATVIADFGSQSAWSRNVEAGGALQLRIGSRRFVPEFRCLGSDVAASVLADYERRNRRVPRPFSAWCFSPDSVRWGEAARRCLVETLPLVAFRESIPGT